jgi:hypothetical protein
VAAVWELIRHTRPGKWEVRRSPFPYLFCNLFNDAKFEFFEIFLSGDEDSGLVEYGAVMTSNFLSTDTAQNVAEVFSQYLTKFSMNSFIFYLSMARQPV